MRSRDLPPGSARSDDVVLAWEASGDESESTRRAGLESLAAIAQQIGAALLVPIDAGSEPWFGQLVGTLVRYGVAALPLVAVDGSTAAKPEALLATLASNCPLVDWNGGCCICVVADPEVPIDEAAAVLRAAVGARGHRARMGWLRHRSVYIKSPAGAHFAIDWPPYGAPMVARTAAIPASVTPIDIDYALLVVDIARLHTGESPVAPSVLWSSARSITLPHARTRVIGVSSLKIAHAIGSVRRFVRNRAGLGVPFWVLRVAFDPDVPADVAALPALAATLARGHVVSGSIAHTEQIELPSKSAARIAVVVHLYYPELWSEFAAGIAALPEPCDVFVSCPMRARNAVARIVRMQFPHAVVIGVGNLGRDVLPFLRWLGTSGVARYEYVLKLHSKKSVHVVDSTVSPFGGGEGWRRQSLDGLIGQCAHATALLRALDANPDVGIVAPAGLLNDQVAGPCATGDLVTSLCAHVAPGSVVHGRFPAGTMFWARTAALALLADTPERLLDFESEAGQVDGMLHHAYERLFPLVATAQGYRTVDSAELLA